MLCRTCRRIFEGEADLWQFSARAVYPPFPHHRHAAQLEKAAFENCSICCRLWALSSRRPPRDLDIQWLESLDAPHPGFFSRFHIFLGDKVQVPTLSFMVWLSKDPPKPKDPCEKYQGYTFAEFELVRISTANTTEDEDPDNRVESLVDLGDWATGMKTARRWLHQCLTSHERCKPSEPVRPADILPTRLLRIGSPSSEKIRLVIHPSPETSASRYATLSHCWGSPTSHILQLTSKSASRLQQGVDISELGQTFQDSILTARRLDIRYIWIDSLCIVQDSKEDWLRESSLMSTVYRNSTINIAATVAPDGRTGCFPQRDLSLIKPCVVESAWDNFQNSTYGIYPNDIWLDFAHSADMPLLARGWVLQEMLLAPRMLHLAG